MCATTYSARGDALLIESQAKMRLADEYDAAKDAGDVAGHGGARNFKVEERDLEPTIADLGLSKQDIHSARQIRDAEARDPGIVRRVIGERLSAGQEPTKSAVGGAVQDREPARSPSSILMSKHRQRARRFTCEFTHESCALISRR